MANLRAQDILRRISDILLRGVSDPDERFRVLEDINRRLRSKGLYPAYRIIYEEGYLGYEVYQNYGPRDRKVLLDILNELT